MTKRKPAAVAMRPRMRVTWHDEVALGPGKVELLTLVGETGSINEAARRMGMSYMRAWSLIKTMNQCFKKPLVTAARGGQGGGGAKLTTTGRRALALYQQMEQANLKATQTRWRSLRQLLRD